LFYSKTSSCLADESVQMVFIVSENYVINNFRHFGGGGCCCSCCGGGSGGGRCGCGRRGGWRDIAATGRSNIFDCCIFQDSFAVWLDGKGH